MNDWSNPFQKRFVTKTAKEEVKDAIEAYLVIKIIKIQIDINTIGKNIFIANNIPK